MKQIFRTTVSLYVYRVLLLMVNREDFSENESTINPDFSCQLNRSENFHQSSSSCRMRIAQSIFRIMIKFDEASLKLIASHYQILFDHFFEWRHRGERSSRNKIRIVGAVILYTLKISYNDFCFLFDQTENCLQFYEGEAGIKFQESAPTSFYTIFCCFH